LESLIQVHIIGPSDRYNAWWVQR